MVGTPSMLAISISPASAGASSLAWAITGSTTPVVTEGSGLLSYADARGSTVPVACCAISGTVSSTAGAGLRLLSVAPPTMSQLSSPHDPRGWTMECPVKTPKSTVSMQYSIISTRLLKEDLLEELASWVVVSVTSNFLATRFCAILRGLLGGVGRLASKLVGLSSIRGIWGSPGQLNLDRS
jgi:hypothetical protein